MRKFVLESGIVKVMDLVVEGKKSPWDALTIDGCAAGEWRVDVSSPNKHGRRFMVAQLIGRRPGPDIDGDWAEFGEVQCESGVLCLWDAVTCEDESKVPEGDGFEFFDNATKRSRKIERSWAGMVASNLSMSDNGHHMFPDGVAFKTRAGGKPIPVMTVSCDGKVFGVRFVF